MAVGERAKTGARTKKREGGGRGQGDYSLCMWRMKERHKTAVDKRIHNCSEKMEIYTRFFYKNM